MVNFQFQYVTIELNFKSTISIKQSGSRSGQTFLIWVLAVCKDYQQATFDANIREEIKYLR